MQFENLYIWQESKSLFLEIYTISKKITNNDIYFRSQLLDATLSVSNNIAEWFERKTSNELCRFFDIAKWSCWEVRNMIYILLDIGYINKEEQEFLISKTRKLSVLIYKYVQKVRKSI